MNMYIYKVCPSCLQNLTKFCQNGFNRFAMTKKNNQKKTGQTD